MSSTFVQFVGLGVGSIRLRRELATKENLAFLFAVEEAEGLLLVSPEGDELELGDIEAGHIVHVLSKGDLRDDCPFTMDRSLMMEEIRARAQEELQRRLIDWVLQPPHRRDREVSILTVTSLRGSSSQERQL